MMLVVATPLATTEGLAHTLAGLALATPTGNDAMTDSANKIAGNGIDIFR